MALECSYGFSNTCEKITRFLLTESSAFQIKGKISVHEKGLTPVQITPRNSGL